MNRLVLAQLILFAEAIEYEGSIGSQKIGDNRTENISKQDSRSIQQDLNVYLLVATPIVLG